jgi:hypothetical protein
MALPGQRKPIRFVVLSREEEMRALPERMSVTPRLVALLLLLDALRVKDVDFMMNQTAVSEFKNLM